MIPLNSQVTVTIGKHKSHGTLIRIHEGEKYSHVVLYPDGEDCLRLPEEVKIRIQNHTISRPFTLWQLNALLGYQVNEWSNNGRFV